MNNELQITEFLLNKSGKLKQLCRVCLSENKEKSKSVYEECESGSIASVVMLCARVQIACQDGLPDIICSRCLGDLEAANSFRVRCELSDSLLRKFYSNLDQSDTREKEEITEIHEVVKVEVTSEPWIKLELEDSNFHSDSSNDPLVNSVSLVSRKDKLQKKLSKKKSLKRTEASSKHKKCPSQNEVNGKTNMGSQDKCDFEISVDSGGVKSKKDKSGISFVCKICGRPLRSRYSLQHHIHTIHSEKNKVQLGNVTGYGENRRFNCSECPYSARRRQTLVYHTHRLHTGEKPYKCDVCGHCFTQPASLISHKTVHSDKMNYTCSECGKQFKRSCHLDRHKLVHSDARNFICEICKKGVKTRQSLASHMKRHLNIRNFNCEHCGLTFPVKVDLTNHLRKHSMNKKFECHFCSYKTQLKRVLISHMRRHTGEKNTHCELCDYVTYDKYALKMHMLKHTGEKNVSCPICPMKFGRSPSLNKHMKRIHKIDYMFRDHIDRRIIK